MAPTVFKRASRMLAHSARRYGLAALPIRTLAKTVKAALEGIEGLREVELKAPSSTWEGVASRYVVLRSSSPAVIASIGLGGWAMAAVIEGGG